MLRVQLAVRLVHVRDPLAVLDALALLGVGGGMGHDGLGR
jgi:hypothetical protein